MNRYDVKVVDDNVESILRDAIAQYEKRTGKILQPAHICLLYTSPSPRD